MPDPAKRAYLELRCPVSDQHLQSATRLVAALCAGQSITPEAAARVVLTAHEMLENLAKYAQDDAPVFSLSFRPLTDDELSVRIETKNLADSRHISQVKGQLENCIGGRGLQRIRGAGDMQIDLEVADGCVTIAAHGRLPRSIGALLPVTSLADARHDKRTLRNEALPSVAKTRSLPPPALAALSS